MGCAHSQKHSMDVDPYLSKNDNIMLTDNVITISLPLQISSPLPLLLPVRASMSALASTCDNCCFSPIITLKNFIKRKCRSMISEGTSQDKRITIYKYDDTFNDSVTLSQCFNNTENDIYSHDVNSERATTFYHHDTSNRMLYDDLYGLCNNYSSNNIPCKQKHNQKQKQCHILSTMSTEIDDCTIFSREASRIQNDDDISSEIITHVDVSSIYYNPTANNSALNDMLHTSPFDSHSILKGAVDQHELYNNNDLKSVADFNQSRNILSNPADNIETNIDTIMTITPVDSSHNAVVNDKSKLYDVTISNNSTIIEEKYKKLVSNLNTIRNIEPNNKLCVTIGGKLSIDNSYVKSITRFLYGNNRAITLDHVISTVNMALILRNELHWLRNFTDDKLVFGLNNLAETYSDSDDVKAKIHKLVASI
jgi:hypothetical protein